MVAHPLQQFIFLYLALPFDSLKFSRNRFYARLTLPYSFESHSLMCVALQPLYFARQMRCRYRINSR